MEHPKLSRSTQYLHKHNAIRPGISVPTKLWDDFQRAIDRANSTLSSKKRLSRNKIINECIADWTYQQLGI